jgi:phage replication-related protein YjqB (UPF0714/DUF867 family)
MCRSTRPPGTLADVPEIDRTPIPFSRLVSRPGVIELLELRGEVGICAFHGGNLERVTEQIASEAAARSGASLYAAVQPSGMRWHVPSAEVGVTPSARLAAFLDHCRWIITIHGYGHRRFLASLLCGGGNRGLARHVARELRNALPAYDTVDELDRIPRQLRGLHPDNPCNLTSGGGVQLELPPRVRGLTPLADAWPARDAGTDRFPHVRHLIDGLATAAEAWTDPSIGLTDRGRRHDIATP